jgi:hypothetical protein
VAEPASRISEKFCHVKECVPIVETVVKGFNETVAVEGSGACGTRFDIRTASLKLIDRLRTVK